MEDALCVHSGWHYTRHRQHGRPEYVLFGHGYWRTSKTWSNGEGAWSDETGNGYSGGMQFLPGTWAGVGGSGRAAQWPPAEQIYRSWLVVSRDHGWSEWGSTATACGLR